MKLDLFKTKFMLFNPIINNVFFPDLTEDNINLESMDEMKFLGLQIKNDLSWKSTTKHMVSRAYAENCG